MRQGRCKRVRMKHVGTSCVHWVPAATCDETASPKPLMNVGPSTVVHCRGREVERGALHLLCNTTCLYCVCVRRKSALCCFFTVIFHFFPSLLVSAMSQGNSLIFAAFHSSTVCTRHPRKSAQDLKVGWTLELYLNCLRQLSLLP